MQFETELRTSTQYLKALYEGENRFGLFRSPGNSTFSSEVDKMFVPDPNHLITRRKLNKTGGQLDFLLSAQKEINGVIAHTILNSGAQIWRELFEGSRRIKSSRYTPWEGVIPVAPILLRKDGQLRIHHNSNFTTTVFSRFCGFSLNYYFAFSEIDTAAQHNTDEKTQLRVKKLYDKLKKSAWELTNKLQVEARVRHGHPHLGNFLVEFIDLEYYRHMLDQGYTVNTLPFQQEFFEEVPSEQVLYNLDRYKMVLRVSDFDQAVDLDEWAREQVV